MSQPTRSTAIRCGPRLALAGCCLAACSCVSPVRIARPGTGTDTQAHGFTALMQHQLNSIFARPEFNTTQWSCAIGPADGGEPLYTLEADRCLIPASNQKIFVAAAALLELGPGFCPETQVLRRGEIVDHVLEGDLVFRGAGAVHFTARYPCDASIKQKRQRLAQQVAEFAQRLRQAGIRRIRGSLRAAPPSWTNMQRNEHYPSAWALSFNENTLDIDVAGNRIESCPKRLVGFTVEASAAVATQDKVKVNGERTDCIRVNPSADSSDYWRLDATDPSSYYTAHLTAALKQAGVPIDEHTTDSAAKPTRELCRLSSMPLADILADMGVHSDNFRAEITFLNLARHVRGKADYTDGARAIGEVLSKHDLLSPGYVGADGSGLSRGNRAGAAATLRVLTRMYASTHRRAFMRCFATAGESGTLAARLAIPELRGRILAKTGTLAGVKALSGYMRTRSDQRLAFSFICNNAPADSTVTWQAFEDALRILVTRRGD